jgi:hypothetical protein
VVGFTGALRRSELVALDIEDVRWTREGMVLNIRVSKTDQEGRGIEVGIPNGRRALRGVRSLAPPPPALAICTRAN